MSSSRSSAYPCDDWTASSRSMRGWFTAIGMISSLSCAGAQTCPVGDSNGPLKFGDGSLVMKTALAVNPDGASASYTPGDHGYTYISNGVNLIYHGQRVGCSSPENKSRCKESWFWPSRVAFGQVRRSFAYLLWKSKQSSSGGLPIACELPRKGRFAVGNGKGRPKGGPSIPDITGANQPTYLSTTTLRHKVNGNVAYVDSATIPGLVVPTSRGDLMGAVAWVRYDGREGFAIVNDTGPAFGEGSVALHQLLRTSSIGPLQPIGPIPTNSVAASPKRG